MKGYNKKLKKFIEYVFDKYSTDQSVSEFKDVYLSREREKEERKQLRNVVQSMNRTIRITKTTAELCAKLVRCEIDKNEMLGNCNNDFAERLYIADAELNDLGV